MMHAVVKKVIAFAKKHAVVGPISGPVLEAIEWDPDPRRMVVVDGITAAFAYAVDPFQGLTKILRLSVPGETPCPVKGKAVAKLFGFDLEAPVGGYLVGPEPDGPCIVVMYQSDDPKRAS